MVVDVLGWTPKKEEEPWPEDEDEEEDPCWLDTAVETVWEMIGEIWATTEAIRASSLNEEEPELEERPLEEKPEEEELPPPKNPEEVDPDPKEEPDDEEEPDEMAVTWGLDG